jgi:hypothetical protein
MSLWQLRWYLSRNEDVKYNSWRERLHIPVWLFPSAERVTPRATLMKRNSSMSDSSLTPIFFRTPRPKRTDLTTHTLAALAAGPIATIGNPHWQSTIPGWQRLRSPNLAHLAGTQEATYNPPSFPVRHPAIRPKPSYGSIDSTAPRTTTPNRSPKKKPQMTPQRNMYGGQGLGIQGLRVNSSFEAATGIGMGSNYRIPSPLEPPPTPDCRTPLRSWLPPKGRLLTPRPMISEKEPAQIRPARLATRKHRSSSTAMSEKSLEKVELDGEGRRMEKRARFEKNGGSPNEKRREGNTLLGRQSGDGDPFKTPELRVVNIGD